MIIVDFSALDRAREERRLRDSAAKDGAFLRRELRKKLRQMERASLRGLLTGDVGGVREAVNPLLNLPCPGDEVIEESARSAAQMLVAALGGDEE